MPIAKAYINEQMIDMVVKLSWPEEFDSVSALVQTVVNEIYGGLWAVPPLPVDEQNWHSSWVAVWDGRNHRSGSDKRRMAG